VIIVSALAGIARGIVGFPLEQPLEAVKTQWQASPFHKHEVSIARSIYAEKGMMGFYVGSTPNMARVVVKSVYRYPLMISLPVFYQNHLPKSIRESKKAQKFFTAVSIAFFESAILCPIERLKVYFMTEKGGRHGYKGFYSSSQTHLLQEIFRGFTPLFSRQIVAWVSFLQADLAVKTFLRRSLNIQPGEAIPSKYLLPGSFCVAAANTLAVMPFDALKTWMQRVDPSSSMVVALKQIYEQGGVKGYFVGWRLRFMMYLFHAIFTVDIIERLEKWQKTLAARN